MFVSGQPSGLNGLTISTGVSLKGGNMASWPHILLLFGGVMVVVFVLPVLLKLISRVVISALLLGLIYIGIMIYSGEDVPHLLNETIAVVGSVVRDVIGRFS